MTTLPGTQLRCRAIIFLLICVQYLFTTTAASFDVFFDRYGDCERTQPFDLSDDDYTLKPIGGGFAHETMICSMTFKAPSEYGVCLTFEMFEITDCTVRIKVYTSSTSSGMEWRILDCNDSKPGQMCTSSRYVTVQVAKEKLNNNRGYDFKIDVEKSNSITEEGVLFASIGVFVGVILGVVALTAILAISILYCCCKHKNGAKMKCAETAQAASSENRNLVQPSAPPVDIEDHHWVTGREGHLYTHDGSYPHGQPPPPYVPPPPYQQDDALQGPAPTDDQEQTYPVKP